MILDNNIVTFFAQEKVHESISQNFTWENIGVCTWLVNHLSWGNQTFSNWALKQQTIFEVSQVNDDTMTLHSR